MAEEDTLCCDKRLVRNRDPNSMSHTQYFDHLLAFNQELQDRVVCEIERTLGTSNNLYCIATTGSDARLEKGPVSLIEIIVFGSQPYLDKDAVDKLIRHLNKPSEMRFYEDHIEFKPMENSMTLTQLTKNGSEIKLVSPNRVIDAKLIYGNPAVLKAAKDKLKEELRTEEGKKTLEIIKGKVKDHRKVTLTGAQSYKGQIIKHYSLEEGVANYNPETCTWSFKQGPLRAVQFAIVRDIITYLRSGQNMSFSQMQPNTIARINQFEVTGNLGLSQPEFKDLCDNYKYFLWQYHRSQHAYQYKNQGQITFDSKEAAERCQSVERIVQLNIAKAQAKIA